MRTIKTLLATIAVLLCSITASAYDFEKDGIYYVITDVANSEIGVSYGENNYTGTITIPEKVYFGNREFTVTSIGAFAFGNCVNLECVEIPRNVTAIGDRAFLHCGNLLSLIIPEGVTIIEDNTFNGCSNLTSLVIPESVTSIGDNAFDYCTRLSSVNIPDCVTSIGYRAFASCTALTNITIPRAVDRIGDYAFSGFSGELVINCNIPNATSIITPGETYYKGKFANCQSSKVVFGNDVTLIGSYAFQDCNILTSITFGKEITCIKEGAFRNCSGITHITIPSKMERIEGKAFEGCSNLDEIVCEAINPPVLDDNVFPAMVQLLKTLRVPEESIEAYKSANVWKDFGNIIAIQVSTTIESGIYAVGDTEITWKFTSDGELKLEGSGSIPSIDNAPWKNYQSDIKKATIGEGITSIGFAAFSSFSNLTSISIPESVTSIGNSAFYGCSSLTTINIPEGVTSIGNSAFYGCSSLTTINIPEGVTSIGEHTFSYTNLPVENNIRYAGTWAVGVTDNTKDKYTLRDNTTGIADYMFQNCSMTEITLPNNLKYIGNYVCASCRNLTSLTIPNSVTSIGEAAFVHCHRVTSITIPSNVTSIGGRAFTGRGAGTSIVVDANNTVYDSRENCNAIICTETNHLIVGCSTTIIPNSVTSIGDAAFMSCGITSVIIPNGVPRIENSAFAGSGLLTSISIPSSVTDIERDAFANCMSLKTIICRNVVPPTCEEDAFQYVDMGACALEVPLNSVATYRETSPWSEFNISAIVPQTLVLNDGEAFENEENMIVEEITYTRTFNNTNWQALYVPFEIPVTEEFLANFEVADLNDVRQYDRDDDGVKDETVIEAFKVKSGATLAANYPYLIRAKEVGEKTITVTDATLYATEEVSIDCSSVHEKFTFTGTYSRKASDELAGCYALCDGVWQPLAADATLGAFRVYLRIESRDSNIAPARAIRMHVVGEDGATDIDELESNANNQQPAVVYDLQGRRITNVDNLKGVYIVNGKKVVK